VEKPTRPLKPKLQEPRAPQRTSCIRYFVMRCYDPQTGTPVIKILNDFPPLDSDDEETNIFYENNYHHDRITLAEVIAFAEEKNINPSDLEIVSLEIDAYLTGIEIRHNTTISDEAHNQRMQVWEQEKRRAKEEHQTAVTQWRLDLEQYKINKAAYDVFKAQEKLNRLSS